MVLFCSLYRSEVKRWVYTYKIRGECEKVGDKNKKWAHTWRVIVVLLLPLSVIETCTNYSSALSSDFFNKQTNLNALIQLACLAVQSTYSDDAKGWASVGGKSSDC